MARETAEVIEQLMSQNIFTVLLYEVQLIDRGLGAFAAVGDDYVLTDTTKTWITNEWLNDSAILTDVEGQRFVIGSNTDTTITVTPGGLVPASGEYTIERWFYLTSHLENLDSDGTPATITYGEDEFSRSKLYLPYPINHNMLHDHELGRFPQMQISLYNPGSEAFSAYYNLEAYDFYSLFERYSALRGNRINITIIFIDDDGDIVTDPTTMNIENQFTIIKSDIKRDKISFTLTSLGNFNEKKIPTRTFSKATCGWVYKGNECGYTHSDSTLTTTLSSCNKLLKSHVFSLDDGELELTPVALQQYQFTLPHDKAIAEDMESHVLGSTVECTTINYLWRVTAVIDAFTLEIKSYGNTRRLLDQVSTETGKVTVNIYEKECCFGHADVGTLQIQSTYANNANYLGFCKFNDIVFNGDFNTLGLYGGTLKLLVWLPVGSLSAHKSYVFGTGATSLTQLSYLNGVPETNIPLETGKKFAFIIRYYGANTINDSVDRYLTYTIRSSIGGTTRSWDATTSTLIDAPAFPNQVKLRPFTERLGIADFDNKQKEEVRFVLFDEVLTVVDFQTIAPLATNIFNISIQIETPANTEIVYNYVAMIMYNQFERYGGFPSIPTSRYWFF